MFAILKKQAEHCAPLPIQEVKEAADALQALQLDPKARKEFEDLVRLAPPDKRMWAVGETFTLERTLNPSVLQLHMREVKSGKLPKEDLRLLKESLSVLVDEYAIQTHTPSEVSNRFPRFLRKALGVRFDTESSGAGTSLQTERGFQLITEKDKGGFWGNLSYSIGRLTKGYPKAETWTRTTVSKLGTEAHKAVQDQALRRTPANYIEPFIDSGIVGVSALAAAKLSEGVMLQYPALQSETGYRLLLAGIGALSLYAMSKITSRS